MKKNKLYIWFGITLSTLSLTAMEDNRGKKRPVEQIQSSNKLSQSTKKVKGEDFEGQEYIVFKTVDNKEIRIPKNYVNVSPTLQNMVNEAFESGNDESQQIPFPANESFTKKRIKIIKKILKLIFNNEVTQDDEPLLNFLRQKGAEQDIIKHIITYLDLDDEVHNILNKQSFKLKTIDNNTLIVPADVLLLHEYFRNILNAGLQESVSREIETNISTPDLELIVDLLSDSYTKKLTSLRFSLDPFKNRESLEKAESLLVKYIVQKIGAKYRDEVNDLIAIISQAHQWELWFIVKACISFYYENVHNIDEIYTFIKNLPVYYYPYCFALELLNNNNVNNLFKVCMQLFIESMNKEQETLKQSDNPTTLNTLISFLPCFEAFERFISLNEYLVPSILEYANNQIEYILNNYEHFHYLKEGNKEVFEALEEILKRFLIQKMPISILPETELPNVTRFFDRGWYLQVKLNKNVLPVSYNLTIGDLSTDLAWPVAARISVYNNSFLYENSFFYVIRGLNDPDELFEYNLITRKTVKIKKDDRKDLMGVAKDNLIFLDRARDAIYIQSRFNQSQLSIPLSGPRSFGIYVSVLNDETIIVRQNHTIKLITYSLENQTFNENIVVDETFVQNVINLSSESTKTEVMKKLNDNLFVVGYPNGTLMLMNVDGSYEIIKKKQLQGSFDEYIPADHSIIQGIVPCYNGKNFAVSYILGREYFYEIWDIISRKKIYTSPVSPFLLLHAYDGKFIFKDNKENVSFEQLAPLIATFQQLMDQYKKLINF